MRMIAVGLIWSFCTSFCNAQSQANNLVEGGKLVVELVKVFKKPAQVVTVDQQEKNGCDLCFVNAANENAFIEVYRKQEDTGSKQLQYPLSILPGLKECLLGISAGVYHYRVYKKQVLNNLPSLEGDIRLRPNEKIDREIR